MKRITVAAVLALAIQISGQGARQEESSEGARPEGPGKGAMLTG